MDGTLLQLKVWVIEKMDTIQFKKDWLALAELNVDSVRLEWL